MLPVMTRLRAWRAYAHPLLLVAVWATLEAATIAWAALVPGDPSYSDSGVGSLGQAIFATGALVLFVALGSRIAWWLSIFFLTAGMLVGVVAAASELEAAPLGVAVLQAAGLWLIWSGNVELYVLSRRRRRRLTVTSQAH